MTPLDSRAESFTPNSDCVKLTHDFDWNCIPVSMANKTWYIAHDFDLKGTEIQLPASVTLEFTGGQLLNGTLRGNKTIIVAKKEKIFEKDLRLSGNFGNTTFYPEWFGASGDGMTDDYEALRKTFMCGKNIVLSNTYSIESNKSIIVHRKGNLNIKGRGSLITNNSNRQIDKTFLIVKGLDTLSIIGFNIDGKMKASKGLQIQDVNYATFKNINIENLTNTKPKGRAIGLRIDISKNCKVRGDSIKIRNVSGGQDGTINLGKGVARALFCVMDYKDPDTGPLGTEVVFSNSVFEWVYGDDGDIIDVFDRNYISDAAHRFIFRNCVIKYASRRLVKGSASGIQYFNCHFDTAPFSKLKTKMKGVDPKPSGGVNFRNADPKKHPGFRNMHGKMINCTYEDSGNLYQGSGSNLIADHTLGLELRGNTFRNMAVKLQSFGGNFKILNNVFSNSHIEINIDIWESERSSISDNKAFYSGKKSPLAFVNGTNNLHFLNIEKNTVYSDEYAGNRFYGLIRHVGKGNGENIKVLQNEIRRKNASRKEFMISWREWDKSCEILQNYNNTIGPSAGIKFGKGARFKGVLKNNRDGAGNLIN